MSSVKCSTGVRRRHTVTPSVDPALLQAEISFWQDLIKLRDATTSDECLERMKHALALAQRKFAQKVNTNSPVNNVYQIRRR